MVSFGVVTVHCVRECRLCAKPDRGTWLARFVASDPEQDTTGEPLPCPGCTDASRSVDADGSVTVDADNYFPIDANDAVYGDLAYA